MTSLMLRQHPGMPEAGWWLLFRYYDGTLVMFTLDEKADGLASP
jgi:hypothetical protein